MTLEQEIYFLHQLKYMKYYEELYPEKKDAILEWVDEYAQDFRDQFKFLDSEKK